MTNDPRHVAFDQVRAEQPVIYHEPARTFMLFRHADVRALLSDASQWKDADEAEEGALVRLFKPADMNRPGDRNAGIGWMDEPEHSRVRAPLQLALFRRVAASRGMIEAVTGARLDALAGGDAFDALADYAMPIPIEVIGRLLGVDTSAREQFRAWSEAAINSFNPAPTPREQADTKAAAEAIMGFLDAAMAARRTAPRDDLISDLVGLQAGGAALSDAEVRVNCMNLLLGGNVSTADLIANGIWLLLRHPGELAKLRADPSLVSGAVEETLRYEPPTDGTQRVASSDFEIGGCPVDKRKVVAVSIAAANRDPAAFPDPHRFDITRRGAGHVAFGGGAHLCIGAPLARMEAQAAIGALVSRFPHLRLADPAAPPAWRAIPYFHGLESLHVRIGADTSA